jgi:hypothetical protein
LGILCFNIGNDRIELIQLFDQFILLLQNLIEVAWVCLLLQICDDWLFAGILFYELADSALPLLVIYFIWEDFVVFVHLLLEFGILLLQSIVSILEVLKLNHQVYIFTVILGHVGLLYSDLLSLWASKNVVLQRRLSNRGHQLSPTGLSNQIGALAPETLRVGSRATFSVAKESCIFISRYYQALLLIDMVKALLGIGDVLKIKLLALATSLIFNTLPSPCASKS